MVELGFLLAWAPNPSLLRRDPRLGPRFGGKLQTEASSLPRSLSFMVTTCPGLLAPCVGSQKEGQALPALISPVPGCTKHTPQALTLQLCPQILQSPMSFFDTTPTGRLMNRFSKDMDELDVRLPFHAENFLQQIFMAVSILVILAAVFPAVLLVLAGLAVGVFILLR